MKCLISIRVRSRAISKALLINHGDEGGWASWVIAFNEKELRSLLRLFIPEWSVFMFHELVKWIRSFIKTEEKICLNEYVSFMKFSSLSLVLLLSLLHFFHQRTSWVVFVHAHVIITFRVDTNSFSLNLRFQLFHFQYSEFHVFFGDFIIKQTCDKGKEFICWRMYVATFGPTWIRSNVCAGEYQLWVGCFLIVDEIWSLIDLSQMIDAWGEWWLNRNDQRRWEKVKRSSTLLNLRLISLTFLLSCSLKFVFHTNKISPWLKLAWLLINGWNVFGLLFYFTYLSLALWSFLWTNNGL